MRRRLRMITMMTVAKLMVFIIMERLMMTILKLVVMTDDGLNYGHGGGGYDCSLDADEGARG